MVGPPPQARSDTATTTTTTTPIITTTTAMPSQNTFPWDSLKAETLRSIVNDLGIPVARSLRKREGMVNVLTAVTEKGLEETIQEYQEVASKEQAEDKAAAQEKASRSSDVGPVRSKRNGRRSGGAFQGVVLAPGSRRTRRPSAKARSSR